MREHSKFVVLALLLGVVAGCDSGVHSARGFRLPADGDRERGKKEFVALACNSCHEAAGVDLPKPAVQPPAPVLGGEVAKIPTDGHLVASIINPPAKSRMPDYTSKMTVRQLTDVVAFVQSRYTELPRPEPYPAH